MDPKEFPGDDLYAKWAKEYGDTGVKNYELQTGPNRGCIAVYREMSMSERQTLARMETIDDEYPGAFDHQKMVVTSCLLYPTLDAYPHPGIAAGELIHRIRQHGHGQLHVEEEMVTEDESRGAMPKHVLEDIKNAREAADKVFNNPAVSSMYKDLIIEMASQEDGSVDPQTIDYLWGLSPGRIRDLASVIEQAHMSIYEKTIDIVKQDADINAEEKQKSLERARQTLKSPFTPIDEVVGEAATPEEEEEEQEEEKPEDDTTQSTETKNSGQTTDEHLPPNRTPATPEDVNQIIQNQ